jgi:hypothetical protein
MAKIRYHIPTINEQKGPTCWYYAAKMLMRFHSLIGPNEALRAQWELLKRVRESITELSAARQPYEKANVVAHLTLRMQREPDSAERQKLREARATLQGAASTDRFVLLDAFFANMVVPVNVGNQWDADFLRQTLHDAGPLYASIYRLGAAPAMSDLDYVPDPMLHGQYVYKLDESCLIGGRHAIVVAGVDDNDHVHYIDPHLPHRYIMVPWAVFAANVNSPGGSMNGSLFGRVVCPNCAHLHQRIV